MHAKRQRGAFTIIELLVVITIIVVLLSLMAPGLSKAVYRGQLLQCAGNLKTLGAAATQYAFDNRRSYPDRDMASRQEGSSGLGFAASNLYSPAANLDLRSGMRGRIDINKTMQCFMPGTIELDQRPPDEQDILLESSYSLWWGWQYRYLGQTYEGMFRMGDRFSSIDYSRNYPGQVVRFFNVLAGDLDGTYPQTSYTSHPDRDPAVLSVQVFDPGVFIGRFASSWYRVGPKARGLVDTNYVFGDGSTQLYTDVSSMVAPSSRLHPKMARVPTTFDGTNHLRAGVDSDMYHIPRD